VATVSAKGLPGGNPSRDAEVQLERKTSMVKSRGRRIGSGLIVAMDLPEQEWRVKVDRLIFSPSVLHTIKIERKDGMHDLTCLIQGCKARVYAPAGTHSICREHFLNYLIWRRRKGPQMFMKYAGMTMDERDPYVAEWANTIRIEEAPTTSAPKT
jgi:hypothetical protein